MAIKSIYWSNGELKNDLVHIIGDEHRHLRVSRAELGERVELFDGKGQVWIGEVVDTSRTETCVRLLDERTVPSPSVEIVLGQALINNSAFERVLEKAVEVGVTRIIPFRANRSNDAGQGRFARWQKIIVEAAKQSKHYQLPILDPVTDFEIVVQIETCSKIMFAVHGEGVLDRKLTAPVLYMIGPEGGWTQDELEVAVARGFHFVRLGSHIMRSETTAIVAAGLIAHQLGVL